MEEKETLAVLNRVIIHGKVLQIGETLFELLQLVLIENLDSFGGVLQNKGLKRWDFYVPRALREVYVNIVQTQVVQLLHGHQDEREVARLGVVG